MTDRNVAGLTELLGAALSACDRGVLAGPASLHDRLVGALTVLHAMRADVEVVHLLSALTDEADPVLVFEDGDR